MNQIDLTIENVFTVKQGVKFGFGLAIGASLWRAIDKTLGKKLQPTVTKWVDKLNSEKESQK